MHAGIATHTHRRAVKILVYAHAVIADCLRGSHSESQPTYIQRWRAQTQEGDYPIAKNGGDGLRFPRPWLAEVPRVILTSSNTS